MNLGTLRAHLLRYRKMCATRSGAAAPRFRAWPVVGLGALVAMLGMAVAQVAPPKSAEVATSGASKSFIPPTWEGIVKIEAASLTPDYRTPWNGGRVSVSSGTGWLVGKNRFITNAHVVANATRLRIRLPSDPRPYEARVVHVAHDCDLAMVELLNPQAVENLTPLTLSGIPQLDTEVVAIGYPVGGERMSVTRGIVSRIDFRTYAHSSIDAHLAIQVDAAINPGNSGGPVLQNGKVVGVAFQGINGAAAQNVGYMIPVPVIQRFLTDISDGRYDHYVDLAINHFPLENPAQRRALGLANDGYGVLVTKVHATGSSGGVVQEGDVLLSIDGAPVYSNGLIELDGERVDLSEVAERKFAGDKVALGLLRDGKRLNLAISLKRFEPMIAMGNQYDISPRYVLYAGLLFQPMSLDLIKSNGITDPAVNYLFRQYLDLELYNSQPDVVILTNVLPDPVNSYAAAFRNSVVDEINGQKISRLADIPEALRKEGSRPDYIEIKLRDLNRVLVLKRQLADAAHPSILSKYGVREAQNL